MEKQNNNTIKNEKNFKVSITSNEIYEENTTIQEKLSFQIPNSTKNVKKQIPLKKGHKSLINKAIIIKLLFGVMIIAPVVTSIFCIFFNLKPSKSPSKSRKKGRRKSFISYYDKKKYEIFDIRKNIEENNYNINSTSIENSNSNSENKPDKRNNIDEGASKQNKTKMSLKEIIQEIQKNTKIDKSVEIDDDYLNTYPKIGMISYAKNEQLYINDWIKYYLHMGVSHIYLVNNDKPDAPYVGDFIEKKYKKYIDILESRGTHWPNHKYDGTELYQKYKNLYDWLTNWDCDLFFGSIYPNVTLKQYLLAFEKFRPDVNVINFNVLTYNDNDICNCLEGNISIPVYERFFDYDKNNNWKHVITKTKYDLSDFGIHNIILKNRESAPGQYTASGRKLFYEGIDPLSLEIFKLENRDDKEFFVKHYQTKTLGEFLKQKYKRTDLDSRKNNNDLDYFFMQNKVTKEKIEYVKKKTGIDIMNDYDYWDIKDKYNSDNNINTKKNGLN